MIERVKFGIRYQERNSLHLKDIEMLYMPLAITILLGKSIYVLCYIQTFK